MSLAPVLEWYATISGIIAAIMLAGFQQYGLQPGPLLFTNSADLASAAVWGMVRSAQSESPGRFSLIELDGIFAGANANGLTVAAGGAGSPSSSR